MNSIWHRFKEVMPLPKRRIWIWGGGITQSIPVLGQPPDDTGWGWINELDCDYQIGDSDAPTHWAYAEIPEAPEGAVEHLHSLTFAELLATLRFVGHDLANLRAREALSEQRRGMNIIRSELERMVELIQHWLDSTRERQP